MLKNEGQRGMGSNGSRGGGLAKRGSGRVSESGGEGGSGGGAGYVCKVVSLELETI